MYIFSLFVKHSREKAKQNDGEVKIGKMSFTNDKIL